ncbi:MAG TPA: hypothetical protein VHE78_00500 [Gemmatimonadaceae bacterium]|nr:hypothetical protein [Gemmatimonadaceae bacterium]
MKVAQIHLSQSLRRVQQFLDTHADVVGSVNTTDARQRLNTLVTRLAATVDEQGTHTRQSRGEVQRRQQLERVLIRKYMTPLAKFARAQLEGAPGFAALTPSGNDLRTERLVQSARSMALAATPLADILARAKFPADFVQQLTAAADAVKASVDASATTRVRRNGATRQVASALSQGRNAVATLDSLVSHIILGDDRLEREWRSAKRVMRPATSPASAAPPVTPAPPAPVPASSTARPVVPNTQEVTVTRAA